MAPPLPPGFQLDPAPAASGAPPLPPGFQLDPPVAPAAPAPPQMNAAGLEVIPDTDPRAGLAIPGTVSQYADQNPEAVAAQQARDADPNRPMALNLAAANKGMIADIAGIPVDLTRGVLNAGSLGVNLLGKLFGQQNDVLPYIPNDSFGGSESIAQGGNAAFHALTGHNVPTPETPEEKARSNAIELASGAMASEGFGPLLRQLASVAKITPEIAPRTVMPIMQAAEESAPTAVSVAKAGMAGAGAGTAQSLYEDSDNPMVKAVRDTPVVGPVGDLLATLFGAAGGTGVGSLADDARRVAMAPARGTVRLLSGGDPGEAAADIAKQVAPFFGLPTEISAATAGKIADDFVGSTPKGFTLADGKKVSQQDLDAAARIVQQRAGKPEEVASAVKQTMNEVGAQSAIKPTVGLASDNPGLISLEQELRLKPETKEQFTQNDRRVEQAALDSAARVAPPDATGRQFTTAADQLQADDVAAAQAAKNATEADINKVGQWQQTTAAPVAAVKGNNAKVAASQGIDQAVVDRTLRPMQEENARRYNAVDPARAAEVSAEPLIDAAGAVERTLGDFGDPAKVLPRGLVERIRATAPPSEVNADGSLTIEPAVTTVGDIVDSYPALAQTEERARRASNFVLADNIRTLRNAMKATVEEAAANGDEAAQRALDADANYAQTLGQTFKGGGVKSAGEQFRRDFNQDRATRSFTPQSETAGRFLQPGAPEKAADLERIISASERPSEGRRAVGQYLMADLANSGVLDKNGNLIQATLQKWRDKWGSAVDLDPQFRRDLDTMATDTGTASQMRARLTAQLRDQQRALADTEAANNAFKKTLGKSPAKAVEGIFTSDDPERATAEIMAKIGRGTVAHDGLKAAIREYLVERGTTSALQKTTTGENPLSFAKLDTLFKQNERALAEVLDPDEMAALQASHRFLKSMQNKAQQVLPGSPTAERSAVDRMWRVVEITLKTLHGGLRGGNEVRNLKLAAALNGGGTDQVERILIEMQFNPDLALSLFGRKVPKNGSNYDPKIFWDMVLAPSVIRSDAGQTPANDVEK